MNAQVLRDHGKLSASTALQKEHLVVFRNIHELANLSLRMLDNRFKNRGTVAHLHYGLS